MTAATQRGGLLRSNVVVALGTAMSRVTGLIRITVLSYVVGQTALADAYNGANNSPNTIYELLLGGVLSATPRPAVHQAVRGEGRRGHHRGRLTVGVIVMTVLTGGRGRRRAVDLPAVLDRRRPTASTPISSAMVGTALARIFLIQIFFYGVVDARPALLNARRRFFAAAWAPVLSNLVDHRHAAVRARARRWREPHAQRCPRPTTALRWTLGLGATLGIALMALALLPALQRARRPDARSTPTSATRPSRSCCRCRVDARATSCANQVAIVVVQNLAAAAAAAARTRTRRRTCSSSSPTVCWPCRSPPRSSRRWPARSPERDNGDVHRSGVVRHPADRAADAPGSLRLVRPAPSDHRRHPAARQVHRSRRARHQSRARRLRGRPRRLQRLPVRAARVLRARRRAHAVRDQPVREPDQHRPRGRAGRSLRRARPRAVVRARLPASPRRGRCTC